MAPSGGSPGKRTWKKNSSALRLLALTLSENSSNPLLPWLHSFTDRTTFFNFLCVLKSRSSPVICQAHNTELRPPTSRTEELLDSQYESAIIRLPRPHCVSQPHTSSIFILLILFLQKLLINIESTEENRMLLFGDLTLLHFMPLGYFVDNLEPWAKKVI